MTGVKLLWTDDNSVSTEKSKKINECQAERSRRLLVLRNQVSTPLNLTKN